MSSRRPDPTAVLDTNLVVSAHITTTGTPAQVLDAWRRDAFALHTSQELIDELADVFTRPRMQRYYRVDRETRLRLLAAFTQSIVRSLPLTLLPVRCRDPKDDMLLACALAAETDYLVTGDEDLLVLNGDPALGALRIVTPEQFLTILSP